MKHDRVFSPRKHMFGLLLVEVVALLVGSSCAWRMERSEHYLGPTFFRYSEQDKRGESIVQVKQAGVFGEGGTQWGIGAGVSDWTAATTLRHQRRDVLDYLTAACTAAIGKESAPSLLPLTSPAPSAR